MSFLETINGGRKSGSDRVTRKFDTQREAIEVAREFARNREQRFTSTVHGMANIRERDSYGILIRFHQQDD